MNRLLEYCPGDGCLWLAANVLLQVTLVIFAASINSTVTFTRQDDGRWRSCGLLRNEDFTLMVQASGCRTASQKLNLSEGVTKELEVTLQAR